MVEGGWLCGLLASSSLLVVCILLELRNNGKL